MKRAAVTLAAAALFPAATLFPQATSPPKLTADQIIDRYVQSRGGSEAARRVTALALKGTFD